MQPDSDNGYHGYWAQDIYSINSHLGTADDLKSLVSTAHSKGMYVMVDVVANHMGLDAISDDAPSPLNLYVPKSHDSKVATASEIRTAVQEYKTEICELITRFFRSAVADHTQSLDICRLFYSLVFSISKLTHS